MAKIISSFFGIGFIRKGGGTVAAIITVFLWYYFSAILQSGLGGNNVLLQCIIIIGLFIVGVWCGNIVEADWGKDSYRVVLDEVLGMSIALFIIPVKWQTLLAALILFRIFDIGKPFFIKKMEKLPSGWGVMLDDVVAGIYANIILQIILQLRWL